MSATIKDISLGRAAREDWRIGGPAAFCISIELLFIFNDMPNVLQNAWPIIFADDTTVVYTTSAMALVLSLPISTRSCQRLMETHMAIDQQT